MDTGIGVYPWLIRHRDHDAWYQRAMVSGDFRPGLVPIPDYAIGLDGVLPDPAGPMVCGGCAEVPDVNDLQPVFRETGRSDFLEAFRRGVVAWRAPTNPATCSHCNSPSAPARVVGPVRLCSRCEAHLAKGGV